jgi:hypothetical protein
MISLNKRATIYLDPQVHRAIKLKAAETEQSISDIVNDALRYALMEDMEDLEALRDRVAEPTISYESALKKLKADGKL